MDLKIGQNQRETDLRVRWGPLRRVNMVQNGQLERLVESLGRLGGSLEVLRGAWGPEWSTTMVRPVDNGPEWSTTMVQNGRWEVQNGRRQWSRMVDNGPEWSTTMVHNDPEWSTMNDGSQAIPTRSTLWERSADIYIYIYIFLHIY